MTGLHLQPLTLTIRARLKHYTVLPVRFVSVDKEQGGNFSFENLILGSCSGLDLDFRKDFSLRHDIV